MLGALGIWAVFAHSGIDLGMGQTSFNEDTTTWASAIFAEGIGTFMLMFAILGIVDSRSPGDFAGIVIGGVVVAIIMVVGPITGASLNPARAFGPELVSAIGNGDHALEPADPRLRPARARRLRARGVRLRLPRQRRASSRCRSPRPSPTPTTSATPPPRPPPRRTERISMATTATAPMKKLLNDPADLVRESLAGLAAAHGDILRVRRRRADRGARRRAACRARSP